MHLAHDYSAFWAGKGASQWLLMLRKSTHCTSRIMSSHVCKKIVVWAVNLYNEFAWAQENFDAGG